MRNALYHSCNITNNVTGCKWFCTCYSPINLIPQCGQYFGYFKPKYSLPKWPLHEGHRQILICTISAHKNETASRIAVDVFDMPFWCAMRPTTPTKAPMIIANRGNFFCRSLNSVITSFLPMSFLGPWVIRYHFVVLRAWDR